MHGIWHYHLACIWDELTDFDEKICNPVWVSAYQIISFRKLTSTYHISLNRRASDRNSRWPQFSQEVTFYFWNCLLSPTWAFSASFAHFKKNPDILNNLLTSCWPKKLIQIIEKRSPSNFTISKNIANRFCFQENLIWFDQF